MKRLVVTLALAASSVSALSDDGWVSVGSTQVVAPASSEPVVTPDQSPILAPSANPGGDLLTELMLQVEQMKTEIASLRGQLEEQQAKVRRMEASQQDRYLDLDSRISALTLAPPAVNSQEVTQAEADNNDGEALPPAGEAYKSAMQLVRDKKFAEAREAFDSFAENYAGDALAVNAIYWSGEVSMVEGKLDVAEARFRTVKEDHSGHSKAADASYKLAVVLDKSGKKAESKALLQEVISQYAGKSDSTVSLAQAYLKKMQGTSE
ncbi:MAG: YbgF trimerization domain-containing protein [Pseudomonadota bacterium]|nr:YbgF trimerization domain-containing protein [Pseudomonadota bacterium]